MTHPDDTTASADDSRVLALAASLDLLEQAWLKVEDAFELLSDAGVNDPAAYQHVREREFEITAQMAETEAEILKLQPVTLAGRAVKAGLLAEQLDAGDRKLVARLLAEALAA